MHKQFTVILIITSIFILAIKDSASFIHTLLHYIPNNPWHQHERIRSAQKINPLKIHTYLKQKHSHAHDHSYEHTHAHAHDVMDHIRADNSGSNEKDASSGPIETSLKIDLFVQTFKSFIIEQKTDLNLLKYNSTYYFSKTSRSLFPPFHPPQVYYSILSIY